jgi:ribosomal protein L11 methyltransferase
LRVAFAVPTPEAEMARAWLVDRFPEGFEECESASATEFAVYSDDSGLAEVRAAFPRAVGQPVESGWEDRWKGFHDAAVVGGLWVGPPWLAPPESSSTVVVDPGRAFGTGAHPTTRACIELIAGLERGSLLDAGCGSGVVSVAAVRLGFAPVHAVDLDAVAVDVARETARLNAVDVEVGQADALVDELRVSNVVVANVELAVVELLLERVEARIAVTSGYLASERPKAERWSPVDRVEIEGWAADVFARRH